jgi:catalase (peroxidase I)
VADLFALGARTALDACGGPEIGFRAGRVDNLTPGSFGVPSPEQDIQTHITTFSKMGFTREEMIALVACGHTIGGVHATSFPSKKPRIDLYTHL